MAYSVQQHTREPPAVPASVGQHFDYSSSSNINQYYPGFHCTSPILIGLSDGSVDERVLSQTCLQPTVSSDSIRCQGLWQEVDQYVARSDLCGPICDALLKGPCQLVCLFGSKGTGKTGSAMLIMKQLLGQLDPLTNTIRFVDMHGVNTIQGFIAKLISSVPYCPDLDGLMRYLSFNRDGEIFVLDGLEGMCADEVNRDYIITSLQNMIELHHKRVRVMVTSRSSVSFIDVPHERKLVVHIPLLTVEESVAVLLRYGGGQREVFGDYLYPLAWACNGYLGLLRNTAVSIREGRTTASGSYQKFQEMNLDSASIVDRPDNLSPNMAFDLASDKSCLSMMNKSMKSYMAFLSFFPGEFGKDAASYVTGFGDDTVSSWLECLSPLQQQAGVISINQGTSRVNIDPVTRAMCDAKYTNLQSALLINNYIQFFARFLKSIAPQIETCPARHLPYLAQELHNVTKCIRIACNSAPSNYSLYFDLARVGEYLFVNYLHTVETVSFYDGCVQLAQRVGTPLELALMKSVFGQVLMACKGQDVRPYTDKLYSSALDILRPRGDSEDLAWLLCHIASNNNADQKRDPNKKQAVIYATEGLAMMQRLPNPQKRFHAGICATLGIIYAGIGKYDEAVTLQKEARRIVTNLSSEHPSIGPYTNNIGWIYTMKRDFQLAYPILYNALQLKRRDYSLQKSTTTPVTILNSLINLAHCASQLGMIDKALMYISTAYEMSKDMDSPVGHNKADLRKNSTTADILLVRASIFTKAGRLDCVEAAELAMSYSLIHLRNTQQIGECQFLAGLANMALGRLTQAEIHTLESIKSYQELSGGTVKGKTLSLVCKKLSEIYLRCGHIDEAMTAMQTSECWLLDALGLAQKSQLTTEIDTIQMDFQKVRKLKTIIKNVRDRNISLEMIRFSADDFKLI